MTSDTRARTNPPALAGRSPTPRTVVPTYRERLVLGSRPRDTLTCQTPDERSRRRPSTDFCVPIWLERDPDMRKSCWRDARGAESDSLLTRIRGSSPYQQILRICSHVALCPLRGMELSAFRWRSWPGLWTRNAEPHVVLHAQALPFRRSATDTIRARQCVSGVVPVHHLRVPKVHRRQREGPRGDVDQVWQVMASVPQRWSI